MSSAHHDNDDGDDEGGGTRNMAAGDDAKTRRARDSVSSEHVEKALPEPSKKTVVIARRSMAASGMETLPEKASFLEGTDNFWFSQYIRYGPRSSHHRFCSMRVTTQPTYTASGALARSGLVGEFDIAYLSSSPSGCLGGGWKLW